MCSASFSPSPQWHMYIYILCPVWKNEQIIYKYMIYIFQHFQKHQVKPKLHAGVFTELATAQWCRCTGRWLIFTPFIIIIRKYRDNLKKQKGGRFPDLEQDPGRRAADKGDHNHPFHINKRPNIICRSAPRFPCFFYNTLIKGDWLPGVPWRQLSQLGKYKLVSQLQSRHGRG